MPEPSDPLDTADLQVLQTPPILQLADSFVGRGGESSSLCEASGSSPNCEGRLQRANAEPHDAARFRSWQAGPDAAELRCKLVQHCSATQGVPNDDCAEAVLVSRPRDAAHSSGTSSRLEDGCEEQLTEVHRFEIPVKTMQDCDK